MSSDQPKGKIRKGGCTYRVFVNLAIRATGQWIPAGVVADLSDVSDVMLRRLLETKRIETADPTAEQPVFNEAQGDVVKRTPCPCGK